MTHHTKHLLATLTTTAILTITISSASANRISFNITTFRANWTSIKLSAAGNVITCPVTLEGSFHNATLVKTLGALVGYVTRASIRGGSGTGECTGGTGTVRQESLPWHIRYRSYSGTLPNITLLVLGLVGASYRIQPAGNVACNSTTEAGHPEVSRIRIIREVGGELKAESLSAESNARIPLESGLCVFGGEGSFEGTSQNLTQLGTTAKILLKLI